jgi:hypothetical protein
MYSITENIYYSQLSSVAILLQPERNCFTSYNTRKGLCSLFLCAIVLRSSPPSHVSSCKGQRTSQLFCVHYNSTERVLTTFNLRPLCNKGRQTCSISTSVPKQLAGMSNILRRHLATSRSQRRRPWSLGSWDRGFESRLRQRCLPLSILHN